jgi:arginase
VAAHWPGIEQAPAAMRAAGLIDRLRAADPDVVDHGDRPVARWVADRTDDRPNAWRHVVEVLVDARTALGAVFDAGHRPLVLGGECTVAIALVAAAVERFDDVGLVYVDGGQDLMIPTDHPEEPILDAMGVAHILDLPGCVPDLAAVGARRPLLRPADVVFVGYGDEEEDVHGLVPSTRIRAPEVVVDPEGRPSEPRRPSTTRRSSCTSTSTSWTRSTSRSPTSPHMAGVCASTTSSGSSPSCCLTNGWSA